MPVQARGASEIGALDKTLAAPVEAPPGILSGSADPTLLGGEAARGTEVAVGEEVSRYRITGRIGAGGMGVVYRAYDPQLDREVALKLLLADGGDGTLGRARMLREAKTAAKIRHPNVVTVYDAGQAGGRVYIAMELIDGVTLKTWLRRPGRAWKDVLRVMLSAGEGLAAAHEVGLVHRDFKPDNVLIGPDGRAHVLDFGLARPSHEAEPNAATPGTAPTIPRDAMLQTLTQTGLTIGTPAYMAPEQHLARPTSPRSDQFSFCVATYEALYGQRPFVGESYAELSLAVIEGRATPPPRRSQVPPQVWQALRRGLSTDPEARYPELRQLLDALEAVLRPSPLRPRALIVAAVLPAVAVGVTMALHDPEPDEVRPVLEASREPRELGEAPEDPRRHVEPGRREPPPPADPEVPEVPLTTSSLDAAALRDLLAGLVPEKAARIEARAEGLALVGPEARRWKVALDPAILQIASPGGLQLFAGMEMPDGRDWSGFAVGAEVFDARVAAIEKTDGVDEVLRSKPLGVVLVRGPLKAQEAIARLLRRAAAPDPPANQTWCWVNGAQTGCKSSMQACEVDAIPVIGDEAEVAELAAEQAQAKENPSYREKRRPKKYCHAVAKP